jgi:2-dehydro-3-deoxyphosphooctonate aldolase (KDO 8-P synthase)
MGPCVIESKELLEEVAEEIVSLKNKYNIEIIFKASFDKANRTSLSSFRGQEIEEGLKLLSDIKEKYKLPITTDVHESSQVEIVSSAVDIIQIPAFLCRQTDLLLEAGKTNKIVNIKKAQFLSGADMKYPTEKILSTGNNQIMLTERGTMFGYNNLVVDFRNIPDMQKLQFPVIMDCTHSVQRPGGMGEKTGGNREFVPSMALAAKAFGVNGYFFEIHPNPEKALCDGPNSLPLNQIDSVIKSLL